jgi:hypothetical protein
VDNMTISNSYGPPDPSAAREALAPDPALCRRVRSEYLEMPGLRLTAAQASRLFDLEPSRCAQVLDTLVREGALWTNGREFLATNVGRH